MVKVLKASKAKAKSKPAAEPTFDELVEQAIKEYHRYNEVAAAANAKLKKLNLSIKGMFEGEVTKESPVKQSFGNYELHLYASGGGDKITKSVDEARFEADNPTLAAQYARALRIREKYVVESTSYTAPSIVMRVKELEKDSELDSLIESISKLSSK